LAQIKLAPSITSPLKTNKAKPSRKSNIAALDGVRAIAALLVITVHVSDLVGVPWNVNQNPLATGFAFLGRTGVVLFFVLSGFLLFMPYAKALLFQEEWPSMRKFYLRRIFRIWPGYYFTLAAMILLFAQRYLQSAYRFRLSLFLTFFMDSSPQTWQQISGPFWTLAIEWQFYMLLPLIALCFAQVVKRFSPSPQQRLKAVLACCLGLIILELLIRGLGVVYQRHPNLNFLVPHIVLKVMVFFLFGVQGKYLEVFALGMIVSACYIFAGHAEYGNLLKMHLQRLSHWAWKLGWVVLIFIALWQAEAETDRDGTPGFTALNFLHPLKSYYAWLGEPIAGVGYALCILAILFGPSMLRWLFETRFLRWIGMLSYGIYMWHLNLLLYFAGAILPHLPHIGGTFGRDVALWGFVCIAIIPFCYLFYKTIEEPGIRLGARLIRKWIPG
jgi:peptidoglycan/LPS O-acetylase OafA/YrhL